MGRLSNPNLTMPSHEKLGVSKPIKGLIRLAANKEKFAQSTAAVVVYVRPSSSSTFFSTKRKDNRYSTTFCDTIPRLFNRIV